MLQGESNIQEASNIYLMAISLDTSFGTASEEINWSPRNLVVFSIIQHQKVMKGICQTSIISISLYPSV